MRDKQGVSNAEFGAILAGMFTGGAILSAAVMLFADAALHREKRLTLFMAVGAIVGGYAAQWWWKRREDR